MDDSYRYTFGGKKEQLELGLNWIDHHARNYDAALGRWMNVDPLAEKYLGWSPYNYVMNSPLRFTDPTGMFIEPPTKPGEIEGDKYYDDDTGDTYEWDGEGGWHSDMQGGEELNEVVVTNESSSEGEGSSSGEAENSSTDIFNTAIGALGFSTSVKNELVGFASKSGELSAGAMKYLKYSKNLGTIGGVTSTLYSGSLVYDQYSQGGIENVLQNRDVLDMGVGAIGLGTGTLVALGLISNPIGWTIGAGVLVYGGTTLIYDIYTQKE